MTSSPNDLGTAIVHLAETIDRRGLADPGESYTAKLLGEGAARCAKKFGEEAVELTIAAALGDKTEVSNEAADVLYHFMVLLKASGVEPGQVAEVLREREAQSGLAEKASRKN